MVESKVEDKEPARRWLGYTCPECHAIFRVPTEEQGKVAECPHCRLPVILGTKGLVAQGASETEEEMAPPTGEVLPEGWERSERSGRLKRRKRVTKKKTLETPDWEARELAGSDSQQGAKFFLVLLAGLLVLTAGVAVFLKRLVEAQDEKVVGVDMGEIPVMNLPEVEPAEPRNWEDFALGDKSAEIRDLVSRFLAVDSVEELLPLVRSPQRVGPLIREYYREEQLRPVAFRSIAPRGGLQIRGNMFSVQVVMEDFTKRAIAVEESGDSLLVDWESWVGYGELSWKDFMTKQPTEPVLMRVRVAQLDYYNFAFSDETRWKSFRLLGKTEDKPLYGYAEAGSDLERKLLPSRGTADKRAMVLRLRYPAGAKRTDQVIIDELVTNGWVLPD